MNNPGKSGLEPTAPSQSEDIALYQLSQILNYKTDGSLVKFRRMPFQSTQKSTEDVDNGHSKECRAFDVDLQRKHFQDSVPGRVKAGLRRCMQAQSHPEHAAAKHEHHRLLFWSEKNGGSSAPSEPPLATCLIRVALLHLSTATGSTFVFRLRGPSKVISPSSRFKISSDSYIDIDSLFSCLVLRAFRSLLRRSRRVAESMGDWEKESAVWPLLPFQ